MLFEWVAINAVVFGDSYYPCFGCHLAEAQRCSEVHTCSLFVSRGAAGGRFGAGRELKVG
jgi:hypothetical protein